MLTDAPEVPVDEPTAIQRTGIGGRSISSSALFRGGREVVIIHRGQEYRLRITKADKLILTK